MESYGDIFKQKMELARYRPKTISTYMSSARLFFNANKDKRIRDLSEKDIEKFITCKVQHEQIFALHIFNSK